MITAEIQISREQLLSLKHPIQFVGIDWETYEEISHELGESTALHLTFDRGNLTVMPVTELHEFLIAFIERMMTLVSLTTQTEIFPTGKATMRSETFRYGVEPDLSFYVSKASIHRVKSYVPNELELAPDIVCEIDIHHPSDDKFRIYADFGVTEFWQYDGEQMRLFRLHDGKTYRQVAHSVELPILSDAVLTEFLGRGQKEEQLKVLQDFQIWLQENK